MRFAISIIAPQRPGEEPHTEPLVKLVVPIHPALCFDDLRRAVAHRYTHTSFNETEYPPDMFLGHFTDVLGARIFSSDTISSLYRADNPVGDLQLNLHLQRSFQRGANIIRSGHSPHTGASTRVGEVETLGNGSVHERREQHERPRTTSLQHGKRSATHSSQEGELHSMHVRNGNTHTPSVRKGVLKGPTQPMEKLSIAQSDRSDERVQSEVIVIDSQSPVSADSNPLPSTRGARVGRSPTTLPSQIPDSHRNGMTVDVQRDQVATQRLGRVSSTLIEQARPVKRSYATASSDPARPTQGQPPSKRRASDQPSRRTEIQTSSPKEGPMRREQASMSAHQPLHSSPPILDRGHVRASPSHPGHATGLSAENLPQDTVHDNDDDVDVWDLEVSDIESSMASLYPTISEQLSQSRRSEDYASSLFEEATRTQIAVRRVMSLHDLGSTAQEPQVQHPSHSFFRGNSNLPKASLAPTTPGLKSSGFRQRAKWSMWSESEDKIVLENFKLMAPKIARLLPGRSASAIRNRKRELAKTPTVKLATMSNTTRKLARLSASQKSERTSASSFPSPVERASSIVTDEAIATPSRAVPMAVSSPSPSAVVVSKSTSRQDEAGRATSTTSVDLEYNEPVIDKPSPRTAVSPAHYALQRRLSPIVLVTPQRHRIITTAASPTCSDAKRRGLLWPRLFPASPVPLQATTVGVSPTRPSSRKQSERPTPSHSTPKRSRLSPSAQLTRELAASTPQKRPQKIDFQKPDAPRVATGKLKSRLLPHSLAGKLAEAHRHHKAQSRPRTGANIPRSQSKINAYLESARVSSNSGTTERPNKKPTSRQRGRSLSFGSDESAMMSGGRSPGPLSATPPAADLARRITPSPLEPVSQRAISVEDSPSEESPTESVPPTHVDEQEPSVTHDLNATFISPDDEDLGGNGEDDGHSKDGDTVPDRSFEDDESLVKISSGLNEEEAKISQAREEDDSEGSESVESPQAVTQIRKSEEIEDAEEDESSIETSSTSDEEEAKVYQDPKEESPDISESVNTPEAAVPAGKHEEMDDQESESSVSMSSMSDVDETKVHQNSETGDSEDSASVDTPEENKQFPKDEEIEEAEEAEEAAEVEIAENLESAVRYVKLERPETGEALGDNQEPEAIREPQNVGRLLAAVEIGNGSSGNGQYSRDMGIPHRARPMVKYREMAKLVMAENPKDRRTRDMVVDDLKTDHNMIEAIRRNDSAEVDRLKCLIRRRKRLRRESWGLPAKRRSRPFPALNEYKPSRSALKKEDDDVEQVVREDDFTSEFESVVSLPDDGVVDSDSNYGADAGTAASDHLDVDRDRHFSEECHSDPAGAPSDHSEPRTNGHRKPAPRGESGTSLFDSDQAGHAPLEVLKQLSRIPSIGIPKTSQMVARLTSSTRDDGNPVKTATRMGSLKRAAVTPSQPRHSFSESVISSANASSVRSTTKSRRRKQRRSRAAYLRARQTVSNASTDATATPKPTVLPTNTGDKPRHVLGRSAVNQSLSEADTHGRAHSTLESDSTSNEPHILDTGERISNISASRSARKRKMRRKSLGQPDPIRNLGSMKSTVSKAHVNNNSILIANESSAGAHSHKVERDIKRVRKRTPTTERPATKTNHIATDPIRDPGLVEKAVNSAFVFKKPALPVRPTLITNGSGTSQVPAYKRTASTFNLPSPVKTPKQKQLAPRFARRVLPYDSDSADERESSVARSMASHY